MPRAPTFSSQRARAPATPLAAPATTKKKRRRKPKKPQPLPTSACAPHASAPALLPSELYSFLSPTWTLTTSFPDAPRKLSSLRCLTYNTFSSSPIHSPHQTTALLRVLREARFDIAALQEVTLAFFAAIQRAGWAREYVVSGAREYLRAAGKGDGGKGKEGGPEAVVFLVRRELVGAGSEVGFVRLPCGRGEAGKALVVLRLFGAGVEQVRFALQFLLGLTNDVLVAPNRLVPLLLPPSQRPSPDDPVPTRTLPPIPLFNPLDLPSRLQQLLPRRTPPPRLPNRLLPLLLLVLGRRGPLSLLPDVRRTVPFRRWGVEEEDEEGEEDR